MTIAPVVKVFNFQFFNTGTQEKKTYIHTQSTCGLTTLHKYSLDTTWDLQKEAIK